MRTGGRLAPRAAVHPWDVEDASGLTHAERARIHDRLVDEINVLVQRLNLLRAFHDHMRPGNDRAQVHTSLMTGLRLLRRLEWQFRGLFPDAPAPEIV